MAPLARSGRSRDGEPHRRPDRGRPAAAGPARPLPAGVPTDAPGVVTGEEGTGALEEVTGLLKSHRVWQRFAARV
ncbi:hypothetical protein GCM10010254_66280 [Streptomyces chromofuscus]|nr:hypothetical protein GCM10010254_66280 [Streptomyces chromofuscus]